MSLSRRLHVRRPYPNVRHKIISIATIDPNNLSGFYVTIANKVVLGANTARSRLANTRFFRSINNKVDNEAWVMTQLNSGVVETSPFVAEWNITPLVELSWVLGVADQRNRAKEKNWEDILHCRLEISA